jgi:hypothetical protein
MRTTIQHRFTLAGVGQRRAARSTRSLRRRDIANPPSRRARQTLAKMDRRTAAGGEIMAAARLSRRLARTKAHRGSDR